MLVELTEISPNNWSWKDTLGNVWSTTLLRSATPLQAVKVIGTAENKEAIKQIIKLREAGFTTDEIIELHKAGMVLKA